MTGCYVKIPIEEATTPKQNHVCMTDKWWLVQDGCVLGYKTYGEKSKDTPSPQCNDDKRVVEHFFKSGDNLEAVFLDVVYWPQCNYD